MQISTTIPARDKAAVLGAGFKTGACAATGEMLALLDAEDRHNAPESVPIEAAKREGRRHVHSLKAGL